MGQDDNRIVKTIRFHPTELLAIHAARGDQTFTDFVLTAVKERLAALPRNTAENPAETDPLIGDLDYACSLCGAPYPTTHQPGCIYAAR